jgi:hypothetical protein
MARPRKSGLDFFPFDVNFFADARVKSIYAEFGYKGEIVVVRLLCAIFQNGYFYEWTTPNINQLLNELPGVSDTMLDMIVMRLVRWGYFDKALFDSVSILSSYDIQSKFRATCQRQHRNIRMDRYCLLNAPPPAAPSEPPEYLPPPELPPPIPPPREPSTSATETTNPTEKTISDLVTLVERLKHETIWSESVCMKYALDANSLVSRLDDYRQHCLCYDKMPASLSDAKRHFCSWLNKQPNGKVTQISPPEVYTFTDFGSKDK